MIPLSINSIAFQRMTSRNPQTIKEENSLTSYLRHSATPAERQAYTKATGPGTKAGTAPRTVAELKALVS